MGFVRPPARRGGIPAPHEVDLVPGLGVVQEVQQVWPASGAGRQADGKDQVAATRVGAACEDDGQRPGVIPPGCCPLLRGALRCYLTRLNTSRGPHGCRQLPRLLEDPHIGRKQSGLLGSRDRTVKATVPVGLQVPSKRAVQAERLPFPLGGVGAGAAGNSGVIPPPADLRPAEPAAGGVREQMPARRRLEHLVCLVHHQRFGDVMGEVAGVFHVAVGAALHPLPGQAQLQTPRLRVRSPAHIAGPVRVDGVPRIALQCPLDGPHRRVQVLGPVPGSGVVDVERQADHRKFGVLPPRPPLALVLPPKPASRRSVGSRYIGGGHGRTQFSAHC